jgi:hypothetical protein
MKTAVIALAVLFWAAPGSATPITVTFSGTVTSAAPLWSYWLPGFGVGAAINGYITGNTEIPHTGFWTFNVAGYTGTANLSAPTWIEPNSVFTNASWNTSISGTTEFVASYIAEMFLSPQSQTGQIYYSGIGKDPNGVTQWDQTWQASITEVAVNVPEPSTALLFGFGVLAAAAGIRRRLQ